MDQALFEFLQFVRRLLYQRSRRLGSRLQRRVPPQEVVHLSVRLVAATLQHVDAEVML